MSLKIALALIVTSAQLSFAVLSNDEQAPNTEESSCTTLLTQKKNTPVNIHFNQEPYDISGLGLRLIAREQINTINNLYAKHLKNEPLDTHAIQMAEQRIDCVKITEAKNVIFCLAYSQYIMNMTFWRPSLYSEGFAHFPQRTVADHNNPSAPYIKYAIGGFNIPSEMFIDFFNEAPKGTYSSQEKVLVEKLYNPLLKEIGTDEPFYIVTSAVNGGTMSESFFNTASHELLHAQLRMTPGYEEVVTKFWNTQVSKEHKTEFIESLRGVYNIDDERVMIDEFQAYILQKGAENSVYGSVKKYKDIDFVMLYADKLRSELEMAGIKAIYVE